MCENAVMAEKRKMEFDSLSWVSEAESADIHGVIAFSHCIANKLIYN